MKGTTLQDIDIEKSFREMAQRAEDSTCRIGDYVFSSISPTVMYVDTNTSEKCRSAGGYTQTCDEAEYRGDNYWFIFRCMYCFDEQITETSCLGTTSYGRRCGNKSVNAHGYCTHHYGEFKDYLEDAGGKRRKIDIY